MAKKEKKEIKAEEVGLPKEAEKGIEVKGKDGKKVVVKMNEMAFRLGDELEVNGLPFKVQEVKGLDIVLRRMDIR